MNPPIKTIHLFPVLDQKLIELLRSLTPDEWNLPTVARLWTVKDVAAHILDTHLRTLSSARDGHAGDPPGAIHNNQDLIDYLNRLNADWVSASRRLSPQILTDLLATYCPQATHYYTTLDPAATAVFSVGWAGESVSANWFHIAREYTEKWHHQQQIRDAVNKPGIMTADLYHPVLDTFMRALPVVYKNTEAAAGTVIQVSISGEGGGDWFVEKQATSGFSVTLKQAKVQDQPVGAAASWKLTTQPSNPPVAHTTIEGTVAWKLFSKSWRRQEVLPYVQMEGEQALGDVVLDMISVMA
ncbi:maleylpyruvate isomerase N-terminal domain-containing protein [Paraflavitalea sp. CAU 1676]|uniref:maleylpyruvate isomerase N-terminal domain-containing protein n=1 Tax=Paraflavitalea sp. CAU 1676 TaxID=3032598 RepID=UPI0023DBA020|nr:maleylpyruvate isomerase N-terminal domain-containing protein [Paraflavitalea sp. CAU 1676]MDF2187740.1 maleylpyruvate isomerase N-terminal domain-containing protein [Paraflavitalea sp. CAU 1676]